MPNIKRVRRRNSENFHDMELITVSFPVPGGGGGVPNSLSRPRVVSKRVPLLKEARFRVIVSFPDTNVISLLRCRSSMRH